MFEELASFLITMHFIIGIFLAPMAWDKNVFVNKVFVPLMFVFIWELILVAVILKLRWWTTPYSREFDNNWFVKNLIRK